MDPLTALKQQSLQQQQQQQSGGPPGAPLQTYLGSSVTPATTAASSNPLAPSSHPLAANPLASNPLASNPLARTASPQPNPLTAVSSSADPLRSLSPAPAHVPASAALLPVNATATARQPVPAAAGGVGDRVPVTPSHDPLAGMRQQAPIARPQPAAATFSFAPSYNAPTGSPATTPAAATTPFSSAQSLTSPQPSPTAPVRPAPLPELTEEQRLDSELRAFFGGDLPPTKQDELKADKVSKDEAGIITLAEAGRWREVVRLCEQLLQLPSASAPSSASPSFLSTTNVPPHIVLRYHSYLVSALLKLRRHADAHIALTRIGPFFSPDKLYQSYPAQYGDDGKEGSMVPFVLHLSRAEIGYYEGDVRKTVDALYGLREYVAATVAKREDDERAGNKHEERASDWRERYYTVCTKLADYYMMLSPPDYTSAVHMLASMLSPPPAATTSPASLSSTQQERLWYQLGRVHLQAGDVDSAASCFTSAAALSVSPTSASTSALHQSLIQLSTGQYTAAQALLSPHLSAQPPPSPSLVTNYALASLYLNELGEARRAVESYLREDTARRVDGGLLAVLRVLYDIGNMGARKKLVEALALMYGSDEMEIV